MKDYNEMAERVLARRDQYRAERKESLKRLKRGAAGLTCCCLAVLLGVGVRHSGAGPAETADGAGVSQTGGSARPEALTQTDVADLRNQESGWRAASEVLAEAGEGPIEGVFVPALIAYNGALYGGTDAAILDDTRVRAADTVYFTESYTYVSYLVEDRPELVAILINGDFSVYEKLFDVTFQVDGILYGAAYSPSVGVDYTPGELVQETDGFKVYQAVRLQGEETARTAYLVDVSQLLKEELPTLFGEGENHAEFWWVALPPQGALMDVPVNEPGRFVEHIDSGDLTQGTAAFFGGSYLNGEGKLVIVLTDDTPENRAAIRRELRASQEEVVFEIGTYTLDYLMWLQEKISAAMANGELPFVTTSGVYEMENRIGVRVTTEDPGELAKLTALDVLGGAIEIIYSKSVPATDLLVGAAGGNG